VCLEALLHRGNEVADFDTRVVLDADVLDAFACGVARTFLIGGLGISSMRTLSSRSRSMGRVASAEQSLSDKLLVVSHSCREAATASHAAVYEADGICQFLLQRRRVCPRIVALTKAMSEPTSKESTMKLYKALLPLAAAIAMAGCEQGRGSAEAVIAQADTVISQVKEEATITAPAELKVAEGTLAHMKQNYESHEYQAVIDEVPDFNAQIEAMKTAATVKQAATTEWSTLNTEVPQSIDAIQARVDSIKPAALPKDVTKEELATAKTELETMKATWAEATTAASAGNTAEATDKGRIVQAKANELKNTLGMNETLASAQ
jgi:hypothetical protein